MNNHGDDDVRSTDFFVTLNTHRQYSDELRADTLAAIADLNDAQFAEEALFDGSGTRLVASVVRPSEIGIEIGPRQGLLHAHFIIEFDHAADGRPISLTARGAHDHRGVNERFQSYFSERLGIDGCYCRASLLHAQSSAKNYNRKQRNRGDGALLLRSVRPIADRSVRR